MGGSGWRSRIVGEGEVAPGELAAHPGNWRRHPKAQRAALGEALGGVGWVQRVIVNRTTGRIVDGHARVALAVERAEATVPVLYVDLDEAEERLVLATFDPIGAMAIPDGDALAALLGGVTVAGESLALRDVLAATARGAGVDAGALVEGVSSVGLERAELLREAWGVGRGDVWEVPSATVPGRAHRLMCGDSTSAMDVARLMGGARASLVVTSPPYLARREYGAVVSDWLGLMLGVFGARVVEDDAPLLVNLGLVHEGPRLVRYWEPWLVAMEAAGWPCFGWYVWDKLAGLPGDWGGRLRPAHEWIFHLVRSGVAVRPAVRWTRSATAGESRQRYDLRTKAGIGGYRGGAVAMKATRAADSVVRVEADSVVRVGTANNQMHVTTGGHPAVFPVRLPAELILSFSAPGGVVDDPFAGSGTTLLAAEACGRVGYGMEMDPGYVAIGLERFSLLGLRPVRLDDA